MAVNEVTEKAFINCVGVFFRVNNLLISRSFLMVSGEVWRMYRKMEINLNKSTGTGQQGSVEIRDPMS